MIFREIAFGSEDYERECALREDVLRSPLGLSLRDENLAAEKEQLHFGLFAPDGALVACAMAVPLSTSEVKIRQMAVVPSRQRLGLGSNIMGEVERTLVARGFHRLVLDARVSAVGFYKKLGYAVISDEFIAVTLPHVRMAKTIHDQPNPGACAPR